MTPDLKQNTSEPDIALPDQATESTATRDLREATDLLRRIWEPVLEDMWPAFHKAQLGPPDGTPYPVQFRNRGTVEDWRRALNTGRSRETIWRYWARPDSAAGHCIAAIKWHLNAYAIDRLGVDGAEDMVGDIVNMSVQSGVNIAYQQRHGALIEATPALETLLTHADLDAHLPMRLVAPPFEAQYLCFGPIAAQAMPPPNADEPDVVVDGVFCFLSQASGARAGDPSQRELEFYFVYRRQQRYVGYLALHGPLGEAESNIAEWVAAVTADGEARFVTARDVRRSLDLVNYVVKVFLYLGLKESRRIDRPEHSQARQRIAILGPKKQAKLARRLGHLYDRITVGPATLPAPPGVGAAGGQEHAPHWRRGHFRMQRYGPANKGRKLIFVAPVLVRADLLKDNFPSPKRYHAVA